MKWQERVINDLRRKYNRPHGRKDDESPEFFIFVYALPDGSIETRRTTHEIEVSKQILDTAWDTIRLAREAQLITVVSVTGTPKDGEGVAYKKRDDDIPDLYVLGYVCPDGKLEVQFPPDKLEQCRQLLNKAWGQICTSELALAKEQQSRIVLPGKRVDKHGFMYDVNGRNN
jgi:hypothetical protein